MYKIYRIYLLIIICIIHVSANAAVYHGKHLSLNFQNIKVRAVLRLLAEFTGINMVVSDAVSGSITLRLKDVPWDQALAIILKTRGLAQRRFDNILFIAPVTEIIQSEKQEQEAKEHKLQQSPLQKKLIKLHYAKASEVAAMLKDQHNNLISERGSVGIDTRTNALWLQETGEKLQTIKKLIEQIDAPVRQVLIEAKIVLVNSDFEQELGVNFNLNASQHSQATAVSVPTSSQFTRGLNVDLGSAIKTAPTGLAVAKLGTDFLIDLELSALESDGKGEIIASPRLITANAQTAVIESGEEIPYQESTLSGGTTTAFKKAVLSLKVTPHINPDNKIMMDLKVNQDTTNLVTFNGVPSILTREIKTNVLVNDQETVVLGGIYRQNNANTAQKVPILSDLPVIGILFTKKSSKIEHEELLIFITPKII